jgi:membrane protein DedA with SNARE-associated domain
MAEDERDPFRDPEASPAGRRPLAIAGIVLGLAAIVFLPIVTGVLGMVAGLVAHVKGDRLGFPAASVAGVGMIAGMALEFLVGR